MAVFVDPKSGERYDSVPDDEAERARSEFGLITAEEYADRKKVEAEGPLMGAARPLVGAVAGLANLGQKAGILDAGTPEEAAQFQQDLGRFGRESVQAKEAYPTASFAGELGSMGALGAVSGGAGTALAGAAGAAPLLGAGAGLLAESAVTGVSQEAVDAVTANRDFSGKAALMNGGINLVLGGVGILSGHYGGKLLGFGDEAAEGGAALGPEPGQSERNWVAELDPGEVPEAVGGARRRAKSAGAAAAANAPYEQRAGARAARPGDVMGEAANDTATYSDDLYDAAAKDLRDGNGGKGMVKEARFLADNADSLTELAAQNTADHLDDVRAIVKEDLSLAAKNDDLRAFEGTWNAEQRAAQKNWAKQSVEGQADDILRQVEASQKAAADVRAGRTGAREAGVEAIDAGGIDARIQKTLRMGVDQVRRAEGAAQAEAIDSLKRSVGGIVRDIGKSGGLDEGTKIARTELLQSFYTTLQEGLQDEAKYGGFGALQRDTNKALTNLIDAQSRIDARLTERLGDTWGATGQQAINRRTVAQKVAGVMREGPLEQRELMRDLTDWLQAKQQLVEARRAHGLGSLDRLDRVEKGLREFGDDLRFSRTLQVAQRVAKDATPGIGERIAGAAVDAVAGRVPIVGGLLRKEGQSLLQGISRSAELPPPGTALRDALDSRLKAYSRNPELGDIGYSGTLPQWLQGALRGHGGQVAAVAGGIGTAALLGAEEAGAAELLPDQQKARDALGAQLDAMPPEARAQQIRTAEAFARMSQRVDQRVGGAVQDLFALAKDPKAAPRFRSPEARRLDERARELDVPRHMARFMGKHDDPEAAFREHAKTISAYARDPAALSRRMAENLGTLPEHNPEMFASMVAQSMQTVNYLAERLPGNAGKSALDPRGYPPTFEEISDWAGHVVGARYPLDSVDDIASNELVPEQMEAVQALWPECYQRFQTAAMGQIHELSRKPGVISMDALEQIDRALDLDGAGEPILSSAMANLIREAEQAEAQRLQQEQQAQGSAPGPMQSQSPQRLTSSALGSLHAQ